MRILFWLLCFSLLGFLSHGQDSLQLHSKKKFKDSFKFVGTYLTLNNKRQGFVKTEEKFNDYNGKLIRKIYIKVIDPVELNVCDFDKENLTKAQKFANQLNLNTPEKVIERQLLFKEGEKLDASLLAQTESNLFHDERAKDVLIEVEAVENDSLWVDIFVIFQDRFMINLETEFSAQYWKGGLSLNNAFGFPQTLKTLLYFNFNKDRPITYYGSYFMKNIGGSYINIGGKWEFDRLNQEYGGEMKRNFVSANSKWAASARFYWYNYYKNNDINLDKIKENEQDVWLASMFNPHFKRPAYKNARIVVSLRAFRNYFSDSPYDINTTKYYKNQKETFYLGSLGFVNWSSYQELELFSIDQVDFVPRGTNLILLGGFQKTPLYGKRAYVGSVLSYARYAKNIGYVFNQLKIGSYINNSDFEQLSFNLKVNYISKRIPLRKWGFRQLVYNNIYFGFNKPYGTGTNLNEEAGGGGFKGLWSDYFLATRKYVMNLESVISAPVKPLGFRGQIFVFADLGVLGGYSYKSQNFDDRFYHSYGIGFRFCNMNLGIGYVDLSLSWYPSGIVGSSRKWQFSTGSYNIKAVDNEDIISPWDLIPEF